LLAPSECAIVLVFNLLVAQSQIVLDVPMHYRPMSIAFYPDRFDFFGHCIQNWHGKEELIFVIASGIVRLDDPILKMRDLI
jgi:hypothetical protein